MVLCSKMVAGFGDEQDSNQLSCMPNHIYHTHPIHRVKTSTSGPWDLVWFVETVHSNALPATWLSLFQVVVLGVHACVDNGSYNFE